MQINDQNLDFVSTLNEETSSIEAVSNDSLMNSEMALATGCAGTFGTWGTACGCAGTFGSLGSYGCEGSTVSMN